MLGHYQRVLVIGAHPDDEDTELLTVLVRGMGAEAAYLSLNRGEGGQNLIGPELGEALGLIRTEELLAARRLDGAHQYFTRAYDFGYSKTLDETWAQWPRDTILKDVVRIVRRFRPQVLVSIFRGNPRDGHGQHQAAGWVTREAFEVAGDSTRFPELLREEGLCSPGRRSSSIAVPGSTPRPRPWCWMAALSIRRWGSPTTRSRWRGGACIAPRTWGSCRRSVPPRCGSRCWRNGCRPTPPPTSLPGSTPHSTPCPGARAARTPMATMPAAASPPGWTAPGCCCIRAGSGPLRRCCAARSVTSIPRPTTGARISSSAPSSRATSADTSSARSPWPRGWCSMPWPTTIGCCRRSRWRWR